MSTEMTKNDVKEIVKNYLTTAEFKDRIERIVKNVVLSDKVLNNKDFEDKIVSISKNVLTQLYKTLWTKRNFWKGSLTNKAD